ncbi:MAG: EH signature domain-containing protein, partial [Phormidium sp.]
MKFQLKVLHLPPLSEPNPTNLDKLVSQLNESSSYSELHELGGFLAIAPRTIGEIISDIQNNQTDRISLLEWAYCLYNKAEWDEQNPQQSQETSQKIWQEATHNSWLKQILFWLLALNYDDRNSEKLAPSLADCFPKFKSRFVISYPLAVQILTILSNQSFDKLAQLCWQHLLTPKQLLNRAQLPPNISIINTALDDMVKLFSIETPHIQQQNLLIKCFEEMSIEQQVKAIKNLLMNVSIEVGSTLSTLVEWLRQNYGPRAANSLWNQLSEQAKLALRQWIKAASYRDFEILVDVLLQHLNSEDYQYNQLKRRRDFWSNYSDRFERIRILLPQESANIIGSHLQRDVDILLADGSDATEVCIFDFGDWFVVEFFRGIGSEIRLFDRHQHPQIEQILFASPTLSIKQIRRLGGNIHDHVYLWLTLCEKWLRDFGIRPNSKTKIFKGLSGNCAKYDENNGLPTPSKEDLQNREDRLIKWRWQINKLE